MTRIAIAILLLTLPGCLAAAVGGGAYVWGKSKEANAEERKARLDYLQRRRAAGATDAQILAEIKATDPEWYEEIEEAGGKLAADPAAEPEPKKEPSPKPKQPG